MKESRDRDRTDQPLINARIRAPQVQLITHEGDNIGVVSRLEALRIAEGAQLDLVMISESGKDGVPVVKVMDFGKMLYERKKKSAQAKKKQKVIQVKEVKMRPKIGGHDFLTKMKNAASFLQEGKRVKVTLEFRGRENVLKEKHGSEMFERVDQILGAMEFEGALAHEPDSRMGKLWSRVYYIK